MIIESKMWLCVGVHDWWECCEIFSNNCTVTWLDLYLSFTWIFYSLTFRPCPCKYDVILHNAGSYQVSIIPYVFLIINLFNQSTLNITVTVTDRRWIHGIIPQWVHDLMWDRISYWSFWVSNTSFVKSTS